MEKLTAWWNAKDKKARKRVIIFAVFGGIILLAILSSAFGGKP